MDSVERVLEKEIRRVERKKESSELEMLFWKQAEEAVHEKHMACCKERDRIFDAIDILKSFEWKSKPNIKCVYGVKNQSGFEVATAFQCWTS